MTLAYEKPLDVVLGTTLRRTPLEATGTFWERLNAMIGETYKVVSVFPKEVFLKNIDATRAAVENTIRLPKASITPSRFTEIPPGEIP